MMATLQTGSSTGVLRSTRRANAGWPGIDGSLQTPSGRQVPAVSTQKVTEYDLRLDKSLAKKLSAARLEKNMPTRAVD
ncbi:hypothetical protein DPMN_027384 [Dreissena polymorpha]|uniref:Uncharacterized protein n=1 Tax=Dreissena polymorpha TaxID=45954 RepID=A0A9D4LSS1_DREPO|nr:hypothetical protein DPMN_027384 [Dreissena polymorpha]